MPEITLRAMRFHALIGVLPHERTVKQPLEIDLTVRVADGESRRVVDYRALYEDVATIVAAGPIDYLEDVGDRVAAAVIASHPRVRRVRVAARKPHVSLGGPLAYAEVVTERSRDD